jgi:pilus assembly protein Flp/PilA
VTDLVPSRPRDPSREDEGATAVEYALLAALIAAVIAGAVSTLGGAVISMLQSAVDAFP